MNGEVNALRQTYEPIINVDEAIQQRREILFSCEDQITAVKTDYSEKRAFQEMRKRQFKLK